MPIPEDNYPEFSPNEKIQNILQRYFPSEGVLDAERYLQANGVPQDLIRPLADTFRDVGRAQSELSIRMLQEIMDWANMHTHPGGSGGGGGGTFETSYIMAQRSAEFDQYDITLDSWSHATNPSPEHTLGGLARVDLERCILFGGREVGGPTTPIVTTQLYDRVTDSWGTADDLPTAIEQFGYVANPEAGLVYTAGGYDGSVNVTHVYVYDYGTDTWSKISDLPLARRRPGAALLDNILYVVGGFNGSNEDNMWALNLSTLTWGIKAVVPATGTYYTSVGYDGKVYVLMGTTLRIYDVATDTWSTGTSLGGSNQGGGNAFELDGKLYFGQTNASTINVYDVAGDSWSGITNTLSTNVRNIAPLG